MKRLLLLALGLASASVPAITTYSEGLTRSSQAQHWQQLRPPQLSDFGYENPFPPELARVGTDFNNDLSFTPAAEPRVLHFDADGRLRSEPQKDGYFRKILGTTAEGQTVVQDFYQDSGTPQTAPFLLRPGYEHNFAAEGNDGRIIWYEKDGSISSLSHYRNGKAQGWEFNFHEGRLYSLFRANPADQTFALLVLDEEEKPQVLLLGSSEEEFGPRIAAFYDLDGRPRRPQDADTATRELGQQRAKTALEWFRKQFLE